VLHLRMPSIDQGVQAFAWAVFFFFLLWLGMLAVDVGSATALILSLLAGAAIFLFVRVRGEDRPGERVKP
jgi:amino acid permease